MAISRAEKLVQIYKSQGVGACLRKVVDWLAFKGILLLNKVLTRDTSQDPYHQNFKLFLGKCQRLENPKILEVGSRNVSGNLYKTRLSQGAEYVGFDVHEGENVDIVGDAHRLSQYFPENHFDALYSVSVFEHLAIPWKAVVEMNRVLKPGAWLYLSTHPTYPPHELPWDFWRFPKESFRILFNAATGFELVRCDEGLPCTILPHGREKPMWGIPFQKACLGVSVLARKTGSPRADLAWDLDVKSTLKTHYPKPIE